GRNRHRCGCAHPPFFLKLLYQSSNLQHRQVAELLHQFVCICHVVSFLQLPPPKAFSELRSTAADPVSFRLVTRTATTGAKSSMRLPPLVFLPFELLNSITAPMLRRARSIYALISWPEIEAIRATAPATRRVRAILPMFPIRPWRELCDQHSQS